MLGVFPLIFAVCYVATTTLCECLYTQYLWECFAAGARTICGNARGSCNRKKSNMHHATGGLPWRNAGRHSESCKLRVRFGKSSSCRDLGWWSIELNCRVLANRRRMRRVASAQTLTQSSPLCHFCHWCWEKVSHRVQIYLFMYSHGKSVCSVFALSSFSLSLSFLQFF